MRSRANVDAFGQTYSPQGGNLAAKARLSRSLAAGARQAYRAVVRRGLRVEAMCPATDCSASTEYS